MENLCTVLQFGHVADLNLHAEEYTNYIYKILIIF